MSEPHRNIPAITFPPPAPHQVNGEPRNPDVHFEHTDVNSRAVIWFVVGLAAGLAVVMLILWGLFNLFMRSEEARKKSTFPMAVEERKQLQLEQRLPPHPRLEGLGPVGPDREVGRMPSTDIQPQSDVGRIRPSGAAVLYREQDARLATYGWVDEKDKKTAHVPIEVAIRMLAGKLPARKGEDVPKEQGPPSQTNSGRPSAEGLR
jgi:hypothetical protein